MERCGSIWVFALLPMIFMVIEKTSILKKKHAHKVHYFFEKNRHCREKLLQSVL